MSPTLSEWIICGFQSFLSHWCASVAESSTTSLAHVRILALIRPRASLSLSDQDRPPGDEYPLHLPRSAFGPLLVHQGRQYCFLNGPQEVLSLPPSTVPASQHSCSKAFTTCFEPSTRHSCWLRFPRSLTSKHIDPAYRRPTSHSSLRTSEIPESRRTSFISSDTKSESSSWY